MNNWSIYRIWEYYNPAALWFILVIMFELGTALLFMKSKKSKKINSIQDSCQKISSPISPMSIPSYTGSDSQNDHKPNK